MALWAYLGSPGKPRSRFLGNQRGFQLTRSNGPVMMRSPKGIWRPSHPWTMVVVELNDTDRDSSLESFLKTSSIQAYKTFGGKRWGFTISKDIFAIITGVN